MLKDSTSNQTNSYPYVDTTGLVLLSLAVSVVPIAILLCCLLVVLPPPVDDNGQRIAGGRAPEALLVTLGGAYLCMFLSSCSLLLSLIGLFLGKRNRKRSMIGLALQAFLASVFCICIVITSAEEPSVKIITACFGGLLIFAGIALIWGAYRK